MRDVYQAIAEMIGDDPAVQVVKVAEEAGELAAAWLGYVGANPRKPPQPLDAVRLEALHVAVAALVAYAAAGGEHPREALDACARLARHRIAAAIRAGEPTDG